MKIEGLFPDEFFKKFKTGQELHDFLKKLQKRDIEKMLKSELDVYLDYYKHESLKGTNACNGGYCSKQIKTSCSEEQIEV